MDNFEKNESLKIVSESEKTDVTIPPPTKHGLLSSLFKKVMKHPYLCLGLLCVILNFTFPQNIGSLYIDGKAVSKEIGKTEIGIFLGTVFFLAIFAIAFVWLKVKGKLNLKNSLILLFGVGLVIRVAYALYTPIAIVSVRQHDVWLFMKGEQDELMTRFVDYRHAEYIEYIARYLKLPAINPQGGLSQLYHPPLHHIVAGLLLRFNIALGRPYEAAVEGIQFLTVFYSSSCMITGYKIFYELGLRGKKLFRATALVSLFPWFFLFSGGVNNDMLSIALGFGAILFTIRWYKNPKISLLMMIAVTLGLSMFTKLSMGLLAPCIAFVFLTKFISVCKKSENVIFTTKGKKTIDAFYMIGGFALFAVVVFPLGLGWQIKNLILWDMPLAYVPSLSTRSAQYIGFHSPIDRLFGFNVDALSSPFVIWGDVGSFDFFEYNLFSGAFKTALFGEDSFFAIQKNATAGKIIVSNIGQTLCVLLYLFAIALVVLSIISIYYFFKNKCYGMNQTLVQMIIILFATFTLNYIIFCFGYPFTCTMNFRYMIPCLFLPIVSLAVTSAKEKEGLQLKESAFERIFRITSGCCVKGFCISSCAVYVLLALIPF